MPTRGDRRGLIRRATLTRGALPYSLARYTVAGLPAAAQWLGAHVYVTDEISGGVESFSDGVYWRRVTDLAIVQSVTTATAYAAGAGVAGLHAVIGPYLRANGAAVGTLAGASWAGGPMSAAGAAVVALQTPPRAPTDLSGAGAAVGTLVAAARMAAALSAAGAATATCVGAAA